MFRLSASRMIVGAAIVIFSLPAFGFAAATQFNFGGDLNALFGPGTLAFANDTGSVVGWGTASSFGLPAMPGGDAKVMQYSAFTNLQGLLLDTACTANGGGQGINQYTMAWDVLLPDVEGMYHGYASFYNAAPDNSNDGELFIQKSSRGVGIRGDYSGVIADNTWYRVAVTVQNSGAFGTREALSVLDVYIDGTPANTITVVSSYKDVWSSEEASALGYKRDDDTGLDGRWTLYPTGTGAYTWLLADEDDPAETAEGYISSFLFADWMLSADEIGILGGPLASGFALPGDANIDGSVDLLDLTVLGANWRGSDKGWEQGDFNGDGEVNLLDLTILGQNWRGTGVSFKEALIMVNLNNVPEPSTLVLLACGLAGMLAYARRKRQR